MSQGIPKNQIKTANTITQSEHEDAADAKRVTLVDQNGEFQDADNPQPVLTSFLRDGQAQQVVEDTATPSNNRPLPVKLTGFDGDVVINSENLNLETQLDGEYNASTNTDPDSVGIISHERSALTGQPQQKQRPTSIRGDSDTDTVSQDVSLHDHKGNKFTDANPLQVTTNYEKILPVILNSKWMELAVYDQVETVVAPDRTSLTLNFKEDGALIGSAFVNFNSDLSWDFTLERYLNDDDGAQLLNDDDTPLFLE